MINSPLRKLIFDEKIRSIWIQALIVGLFAFLVYTVSQTTAYNLEKRGIGTGFGFLKMSAGYDISFSLIDFTSKDTHLRAYFVGVLNTLLVSVTGVFLATILGFLVGVIRLSSNWLFRNIAYVYVEFTRNVPVLLQIILWYSILIHLPKVKQAVQFLEYFYLTNRGLYSPSPIFLEGFRFVAWSFVIAIIFTSFLKKYLRKKQNITGKQYSI